MEEKTDNYRFDNKGGINGWDEIRTFKLEIKNTRSLPVKIEIKRNIHPRDVVDMLADDKPTPKRISTTCKYLKGSFRLASLGSGQQRE